MTRAGRQFRGAASNRPLMSAAMLQALGIVRFLDLPTDLPWGATSATFEDLYGNVFVVESPRRAPSGEKH